jgi:hypothetical protein
VVLVFTSSGGRYLCDSVINPHEVGILRNLGDDFTRAYPLSLTRYHSDRHKALFRGSVHPAGDLIESLREILDGKGFTEMSAPFVSLLVAFTSGVLVVVGFIGGCIGRQLVCRDVVEVTVESCPGRSWRLASSHGDLAVRGTETEVSSRHLGWSMFLCWS